MSKNRRELMQRRHLFESRLGEQKNAYTSRHPPASEHDISHPILNNNKAAEFDRSVVSILEMAAERQQGVIFCGSFYFMTNVCKCFDIIQAQDIDFINMNEPSVSFKR